MRPIATAPRGKNPCKKPYLGVYLSMSHSRIERDDLDAVDYDPDDGQDPKAFHDRRRLHKRPTKEPGRKSRQLAAQVADQLRLILAGLADPILADTTVVSVQPAPNSGRLMVTVAGPSPTDAADTTTVLTALERATSVIRRDVASAITRRYAPELVFRVV